MSIVPHHDRQSKDFSLGTLLSYKHEEESNETYLVVFKQYASVLAYVNYAYIAMKVST